MAWDLVQNRFANLDVRTVGANNLSEMNYHGAFFMYGVTAMIRMWLEGGCRETPQELYQILLRNGTVQTKMISWQ